MVSEAATCSLDCALLTERKLRSAFSDVCFHHHLQLDPRFQLQSSQSAVFNHQYGGFSPSSEQSLDDSANHTPRSSGCRSPDVSSLTNPSKNSQIASTCKSSVVSLHRSYHTNDFPAQEFDVSPADIKPLPPLSTTGSTRLEKYPLAKDTILIENVPVKNPTLDPSLAAMVPQLRALSICCFNEDTTVLISKKTGWRMNLLVTPDKMHLLGFLSYRVRGSVLEISKLAVCDDCRNRGYGRRLVKGILATAKALGNVEYVSLSSLAKSAAFYQRLGFKRYDSVSLCHVSEKELERITPGQVYMEKRVKKHKRRTYAKARR